MAAPTPEIVEILTQVQDELTALVAAGLTGTVKIHCGTRDIVVEVDRKRKPVKLRAEPVRIK